MSFLTLSPTLTPARPALCLFLGFRCIASRIMISIGCRSAPPLSIFHHRNKAILALNFFFFFMDISWAGQALELRFEPSHFRLVSWPHFVRHNEGETFSSPHGHTAEIINVWKGKDIQEVRRIYRYPTAHWSIVSFFGLSKKQSLKMLQTKWAPTDMGRKCY